jgi:hypothetical protein
MPFVIAVSYVTIITKGSTYSAQVLRSGEGYANRMPGATLWHTIFQPGVRDLLFAATGFENIKSIERYGIRRKRDPQKTQTRESLLLKSVVKWMKQRKYDCISIGRSRKREEYTSCRE